jgi:hypothetical protein
LLIFDGDFVFASAAIMSMLLFFILSIRPAADSAAMLAAAVKSFFGTTAVATADMV